MHYFSVNKSEITTFTLWTFTRWSWENKIYLFFTLNHTPIFNSHTKLYFYQNTKVLIHTSLIFSLKLKVRGAAVVLHITNLSRRITMLFYQNQPPIKKLLLSSVSVCVVSGDSPCAWLLLKCAKIKFMILYIIYM